MKRFSARHAIFLIFILLASREFAAAQNDPLTPCRELVADPTQKEKYRPYGCYVNVARKMPDKHDQAREELMALFRLDEQNPRPLFALGALEWNENPRQALKHYRQAAEISDRIGDFGSSLSAYKNLLNLMLKYAPLSEVEKLLRQIREVLQAARQANHPDVLSFDARVRLVEAKFVRFSARDLGLAYRELREIQHAFFNKETDEKNEVGWQIDFLSTIGNLAHELGRYEEAQEYYERLTQLARTNGNEHSLALGKFNIANNLLEQWIEEPRKVERQAVVDHLNEALPIAMKAKHGSVAARISQRLALMSAAGAADEDIVRRHFENCIEVAQTNGLPHRGASCRWAYGRYLANRDPQAAQRMIDLAAPGDEESGWSKAYHAQAQALVSWASGSRQRAMTDSLLALKAIENMRGLQTGGAREGLFSAWTEFYYWLSGRLLQEAETTDRRSNLESAFTVVERMRARALLEKLDASEATRERRAELLADISRLELDLTRSSLSEDYRMQAEDRLRQLQDEEGQIRSQLLEDPAYYPLSLESFVPLPRVERHLNEDEAMLSFQAGLDRDMYGEFGGGSWLLVSTSNGTRSYRLPGRAWLQSSVTIFQGYFGRRDGSDALPSVPLYKKLLEKALGDLPSGVRRLVIVPDGVLHHLPFGALRPSETEAPLATRYRLLIAPSATLWLKWRTNRSPAASSPALALAAPEIEDSSLKGAKVGGEGAEDWIQLRSSQLGPLRYAVREGKAMIRRLGGTSQLRTGAKASESFLKSTNLTQFRILHLAAHAVVDDTRPDRSAVVLAPGNEGEDGLLHPSEIVELDLAGRVVVLSACQSASGAVLRGEGVVGLARSFFQAGAQAVVGSLWPLRDDDAADFFDDFYSYLSRGESVTTALNSAQRARLDEGAPAEAWAGLVVLGDGDVIPFPGGITTTSQLMLNWPLAISSALVVAAILAFAVGLRGRPRK